MALHSTKNKTHLLTGPPRLHTCLGLKLRHCMSFPPLSALPSLCWPFRPMRTSHTFSALALCTCCSQHLEAISPPISSWFTLQETAQKTSPRTSPQSTIGISYPYYYVPSCAIYILDAVYLLTSCVLQLECRLLCCLCSINTP